VDDILYWLLAAALYAPLPVQRWLENAREPSGIFSAKTSLLRAMGFSDRQIAAIKKPDWKNAEKIRDWTVKNHCTLLPLTDPRYPALLRGIHGAPLLLYVQGDTALLSDPQIAMVGARNASPSGLDTAVMFGRELAATGLVVTSGLALGIDGASHRGALASGKTIAVLGTGSGWIYPSSHRSLAEKILADNGAIVSELPPDTPPRGRNFPLRNRIISGLACGVLVVEAARRSGSLITARYALEQNREVFAIPGSIHNPQARGCHDLIRRGAKLVETIQDVISEISVLARSVMPKGVLPPVPASERLTDPKACLVLAQTDYAVTPRDVIQGRSGLTAAEVSSILLILELAELVKPVPGGYVRVPTHKPDVGDNV